MTKLTTWMFAGALLALGGCASKQSTGSGANMPPPASGSADGGSPGGDTTTTTPPPEQK